MNDIVPLGDQAALVYFDDEAAALHFAKKVRSANASWLVDVVSSYFSAAVFFDLGQITFAAVAEEMQRLEGRSVQSASANARLHTIPCCYELALDIERIAERTQLTPDEIVRLHSDHDYTVYAIGFCPGFPFLGYLPPPLCNVPRLQTPRMCVEAGSVGLTGRQTGIYTEARPGGWNIVGRTPLILVDVADGYFPIRAGDRVRFERIDAATYERLKGERLA